MVSFSSAWHAWAAWDDKRTCGTSGMCIVGAVILAFRTVWIVPNNLMEDDDAYRLPHRHESLLRGVILILLACCVALHWVYSVSPRPRLSGKEARSGTMMSLHLAAQRGYA